MPPQLLALRAGRLANPGQQPPCQLPVSPYPAMAAARFLGVTGRVCFNQLNIRYQPGAGVTAFQQIVAQDQVLGKPAIGCLTERINVIDTLANKRALAEHILIDVGYLPRIGIETRVTGEQPRKTRLPRTDQAYGHPGLQNGVPLDNTPLPGVVHGPVQGVRQIANEGVGGVPGKLGVGIQGDDIPDRPENGTIADDGREGCDRLAP